MSWCRGRDLRRFAGGVVTHPREGVQVTTDAFELVVEALPVGRLSVDGHEAVSRGPVTSSRRSIPTQPGLDDRPRGQAPRWDAVAVQRLLHPRSCWLRRCGGAAAGGRQGPLSWRMRLTP